jgi:hypothetical protein
VTCDFERCIPEQYTFGAGEGGSGLDGLQSALAAQEKSLWMAGR